MIRVRIKGAHDVRVTDEEEVLHPGEEQAVIATISNGICGSDMHRYKGTFEIMHPDWLTGHEVGGYIKEICSSKRPELKPGMKVAVNPEFGCGTCVYCRNGLKDLCDKMDFYGTMGDEIIVPVESLIPLDKDFDMRYSGIIEPAAVAVRATEGLPGKNVAIIGAGSIGVLQQQILMAGGGKVIVLDTSDYSVHVAESIGASKVIKLSDSAQAAEEIRSFMAGDQIDCVLDNVCIDSTIALAIDVVKHGGEIRMVGVNLGRLSFHYTDVLFRQIVLRPSHIYTKEHFDKVNELVRQGVFHFEKIVSKFFPLREADKAFAFKATQPSTKVLLLTRDEDIPGGIGA